MMLSQFVPSLAPDKTSVIYVVRFPAEGIAACLWLGSPRVGCTVLTFKSLPTDSVARFLTHRHGLCIIMTAPDRLCCTVSMNTDDFHPCETHGGLTFLPCQPGVCCAYLCLTLFYTPFCTQVRFYNVSAPHPVSRCAMPC